MSETVETVEVETTTPTTTPVNRAYVRKLHSAVLFLLDKANNTTDRTEKNQLLNEAFDKEKEAAMLHVDRKDLEPSRSYLFANAIEIGSHLTERTNEVDELIQLGVYEGMPEKHLNQINYVIEHMLVEEEVVA